MATLLDGGFMCTAASAAAGMLIGGRYELARLVGRGGHGSVWAARHLGTGQEIALKILQPPEDVDRHFSIKRFFLEARVTSGLLHPNTVRVFDFGQDDSGLVYIAMELLSGRSLSEELKERKAKARAMSESEAIVIADAVLRSLAEAHAAGLVHRDLKPDNIFLHEAGGDRIVKVLDFGIVKLGGAHPTLSTPTSTPGTPAFMSPEQALSGDVDARSDLYSVGAMLYQLVANELPFLGASDAQTLYMHAYEKLPDLSRTAKTQVSTGFVAVVSRAMAKERAARFQSAREMREALAAVARGAPLSFRPSHGRGRAAAALAVLFAASVIGAVALRMHGRAEPVGARPAPVARADIAGTSSGAASHASAVTPPIPSESAPAPVPALTASPEPTPRRMRPKPKRRDARPKDDLLHRRIEDLVGGDGQR
jgi:eukaryotic-like serine/threonine-protein kinase